LVVLDQVSVNSTNLQLQTYNWLKFRPCLAQLNFTSKVVFVCVGWWWWGGGGGGGGGAPPPPPPRTFMSNFLDEDKTVLVNRLAKP
jgi:hypothetical protein